MKLKTIKVNKTKSWSWKKTAKNRYGQFVSNESFFSTGQERTYELADDEKWDDKARMDVYAEINRELNAEVQDSDPDWIRPKDKKLLKGIEGGENL